MKYIECDCCGRKIYIGENIVMHRLFCGIYCSDTCFIKSKVPERILSELNMDIIQDNNAELKED